MSFFLCALDFDSWLDLFFVWGVGFFSLSVFQLLNITLALERRRMVWSLDLRSTSSYNPVGSIRFHSFPIGIARFRSFPSVPGRQVVQPVLTVAFIRASRSEYAKVRISQRPNMPPTGDIIRNNTNTIFWTNHIFSYIYVVILEHYQLSSEEL